MDLKLFIWNNATIISPFSYQICVLLIIHLLSIQVLQACICVPVRVDIVNVSLQLLFSLTISKDYSVILRLLGNHLSALCSIPEVKRR